MTRIQHRRDTSANWASVDPTPAEGELCYDTTTGAVVCGDGSSKHSELPDLRKQFKNVVTVCKDGTKGSADFICSDSVYGGNDAECIQTAINYAISKNIHIIVFSSGIYVLKSVITVNSNIILEGLGIVEFTTPSNFGTYVFKFLGTEINTTGISLSVSSVLGDKSITVLDGSDVHIGDIVLITNTDLWCPDEYPLQNTGESYLVTSISSNVITLNQPLLRSYTTEKSSKVYIYRPITVNIKNINFSGYAPGGASNIDQIMLYMQYCVNSSIVNCEIGNSCTAAIDLVTCYNVKIENNYIHDCIESGGYGYGVSCNNASTAIKIHDNDLIRCKHCVTCGSSSYNGLNRDITVDGNYIIAGNESSPIDSHTNTINYTVTDNIIHAYYSGISGACVNGAEHLIFKNNTVFNGSAVRNRASRNGGYIYIKNNVIIGGFAYYDKLAPYNKNIIDISDNTLINPTYCASIRYECYDLININNNKIYNASDNGIYIEMQSNVSKPTQISIENNTLNSIYYSGIFIRQYGTTHNANVIISGNNIKNANMVHGATHGISIWDINNAIISKNNISVSSGSSSSYGINEYQGLSNADYNNITDNNVKSCPHPMHIVGTHTIVKDNPGYITESTGTATITASTTSVVVNHGLVAAPTKYYAFPSANLGNCWIDTVTATQMTIHCSTAPETDTTVSWSASV